MRDIMSCDPNDYGGHPALKLPTLRTSRGSWFGALSICRELCRLSRGRPWVVWPEDLVEPLTANAQELTVQAMTTEVSWLMSKTGGGDAGNAHRAKMHRSLADSLAWLEHNLTRVLDALPPQRHLSYLEATLFCLITHLAFRDVLPVRQHAALQAFCQAFSTRTSAAATPYRFDP